MINSIAQAVDLVSDPARRGTARDVAKTACIYVCMYVCLCVGLFI